MGDLAWQSYFSFVTFMNLFFLSYLTFIIGKILLLSFFSFIFKAKILQSFISSQLTTWFSHDSQKASMPPGYVEIEILLPDSMTISCNKEYIIKPSLFVMITSLLVNSKCQVFVEFSPRNDVLLWDDICACEHLPVYKLWFYYSN